MSEFFITVMFFFPYETEESARKIKSAIEQKENNCNICVIMLFQRQNLLENIFPAQWKTEFQFYFSQQLLKSARKENKQINKKQIYIYIFFFSTVMNDIKIQKKKK